MKTMNDETTYAAVPKPPVGPFHAFANGREVWIAEAVLNLSTEQKHEWAGYTKMITTPVGPVYTVIKTASLSTFEVSEPIDEVRTRLGWVSDKEKGK